MAPADDEVMARLFAGARCRWNFGPCRVRLTRPPVERLMTIAHEMGHGWMYWLLHRRPFYVADVYMLGDDYFPRTFDAGFADDAFDAAEVTWRDALVTAAGPGADACVALVLLLAATAGLVPGDSISNGGLVPGDVLRFVPFAFGLLFGLQALLNLLPDGVNDGGKLWAFVRGQRAPAAAACDTFALAYRTALEANPERGHLVRRIGVKVLVDALRAASASGGGAMAWPQALHLRMHYLTGLYEPT